jgi:hypothetical protein
MKLRLRDDSVRLRLSRSEVAALVERGRVETTTRFGPEAALTYRVIVEGERVAASVDPQGVTVTVPRSAVEAWAGSDELAVVGDHSWVGGSVRILVEKDLACTKERPGEDESDTFPSTVGTAHCR